MAKFLVEQSMYVGTGSPEGSVTATPGYLYFDDADSLNSLWIKNSGTGNIGWRALSIPDKHTITNAAIVTNNGAANSFTNVVTQNFTPSFDGDYTLTISFNFNSDATTSDIVVRATLGGNALDLNDRDSDPQGQFQIHREELKDSANGSGGAITGTGSGQKKSYLMRFIQSGLTGGVALPFVLDVGSEAAGIECSVWNLIVTLESI